MTTRRRVGEWAEKRAPVQPRSDHDQTPGEVHEVLHAINGTVLPIASVAPDISAIRRHVKSIESSVQLMEKYL